MGGGDQTNPAQQTWQQYQQQQTYKDLGNTVAKGLQSAGQSVAGANSGLSGQVAPGPQPLNVQGGAQPVGVSSPAGPLFSYGSLPGGGGPIVNYGSLGAGGGGGGAGGSGIDQQQLAQILHALGYG